MARSWRNCFTLFVIILTLIATSIAVIPNFGLRNATHTSGSIHMKFTGLLSQNYANFMDSLNQLQLTDCYGKWEINSHDAPRNLTAYDYSIDELNRITDMNASNQTRIYQNQVKPPNSLTPHGRIIIQSDADFASQGWPGNGTRENPYHIANLQFLVRFTWTMIMIRNTRVHFIVSNCWMEKAPEGEADVVSGIELTNVTNGVIANTIFTDLDSAVIILSSEANDLVNNSCFNIEEGFTVSDSNTTSLVNNTCTDTDIGINVWNSHTTNLINNTCTNSRRGILVRESNAITITNNTCFDADFGLLIFDSFSTEIINNTIQNSRYFGCEIYPVNDNILANNSLVNCGFFFGAWEERSWVGFTDAPTRWGVGSSVDVNTQITGNTVNRRPLLLWVGRVDFTVPLGAGQVILLNCSIVTVKNQYLSDASIGIFLCFTSRSRVFNNTCTGHSVNGIRMQNCEYITVNNNLCTNNSVSGITLDQTWDTNLTNNQCNNNNPGGGRGIHLFESYDNELLNNTCNHNRCGILLESASGNQLHNNTCNHNRCGILLESASGNQLHNNTCNHNQEFWEWGGEGEGISIYGDENTVRLNRCSGNWVGIEIRGQDNNVLENTCTNNSRGIYLSSDTTPVSDNLCVNNSIGIYIYGYRDLIITNNTMIHCGLYLYYLGREWMEPVDISDNTVNGHPLVFLKNRVNIQVWSRAGQIILFNCRGITVRDQRLTDCSYGLLVYCTNHSLFKDNWLGNNEEHGILVRDSHNNHFTRNIFFNNDGYGIYLYGGCQNNIVEWNVFLCNASHDARDHGPDFQTPGANIFDYNYWTNYSGNRVIVGGFGDIPYNISGNAGNCDLHPLITPFSVLALQSAEQLLLLFEGVVILFIVIVVFVLIRRKFRRHPLSSAAILSQR